MTWYTYLQSFKEIQQYVFEFSAKTKHEEHTDGWGAFQYLPSRAFGVAQDNNRGFFIIWPKHGKLYIFAYLGGASFNNQHIIPVYHMIWKNVSLSENSDISTDTAAAQHFI